MLTSAKTHYDENCANPAKDIDEQVRKALAAGESLYNLDTEKVKELMPEVVLTQSLCQVCSIDLVTVERLVLKMKIPAKVLDLNPKTLAEVVKDIEKIGEAIGCEEAARAVTSGLNQRILTVVENAKKRTQRPNVAFFEWTDPIFPGGHWTPEIIEMAGGSHPLGKPRTPSVDIKDDDVTASNPDIIIIAPCGIAIPRARDLVEIIERDPIRGKWFRSLKAYKNKKIVLVDGNEMFNRPGPRLVDALEFCEALFTVYAKLGETEPFDASAVPFEFPWCPL
jgi:ABC-type Fe3+-hydroxamate transport system substrate-binding protein